MVSITGYGSTGDKNALTSDKIPSAVQKQLGATGLVESLVTASDENESVWKEIEAYLHVESKKHALAWKKLGQ